MQISNFPRAKLCNLPSPFHKARKLSEKLNGPQIFFKRDDLISLGLGGNKLRKLEFLFGDALEKGADTVLTTGPVQSNHARQVAAAAVLLGLEAHLILQGEEPLEYKGNLLISNMFGAKIHFVSADAMDEDIVARKMEEVADGLSKLGKK
ncbi:MAG: pyridoxal-phosphate dependent enzyme, partial [Fervidobacterium sp.]